MIGIQRKNQTGNLCFQICLCLYYISLIILCRLEDLNNEKSAVNREQQHAMQQLHLQNQNLTLSFKVRYIWESFYYFLFQSISEKNISASQKKNYFSQV